MNLYEVDKEIMNCIDTETGEVLDSERLNALMLEREKKIEGVSLWIKNLRAEAEAYKAEKDVFAQREKKALAKAESLKNWLYWALDGEKFSTNKVAVSFRRSEAVQVQEDEFMKYVQASGRDDLVTYKDPAPNKTAIKEAIKAGCKVGGCELVERKSMTIK